MAPINKTQVTLALASIALALALIGAPEPVAALDPLVNTGTSEISPSGRHVGVNVPGLFWMKLDTRGEHNGVKIEQSVLSGFVKLSIDRARGADGNMTGPVQVKVAGMTMYDNGQKAPGSS